MGISNSKLGVVGQENYSNDGQVMPGAFPPEEEVYDSPEEFLAAKYAQIPVRRYTFDLFHSSKIRDTDFGDFCFGRLVNQVHQDIGSGTARGFERGDVVLQTVDPFKRTKPFPFFALPLEIRNKILRMLLKSFLHRFPDGNEYFDVSVGTHRSAGPKSDILFIGDYDDFRAWVSPTATNYPSGFPPNVVAALRNRLPEPALTPGERDQAVDSFELEKWRHFHRQTPHPNRLVHTGYKHQYKVEATPYVKRWDGVKMVQKLDYFMFEQLRNLSNVNKRLRQELGDLLWKRSHINYKDDISMKQLRSFLQQRPAIHSGIKSLSLSLATADLLLRTKSTSAKRFLVFVNYATEVLTLETLKIDLQFTEYKHVRDLAHGRGALLCLKKIRDIPVTIRFELEVPLPSLEEEEEHAAHKKSFKHYLYHIKDHLTPNALRKKVQKNDVEEYLRSRPGAQAQPPRGKWGVEYK